MWGIAAEYSGRRAFLGTLATAAEMTSATLRCCWVDCKPLTARAFAVIYPLRVLRGLLALLVLPRTASCCLMPQVAHAKAAGPGL